MEFVKIYQETFLDIKSRITRDDLISLSEHNYLWHPDQFNMVGYLEKSVLRYRKAFRYILDFKGTSHPKILDVGGFFGVFPVTLKKLGYNVAMTEKYEYYKHNFGEVKKYIEENGVKIYDADPVSEQVNLNEKFDIVTCLALLEHLPDSPKQLFENFRANLNDGGGLLIEVPNIAYYPKRKAFLKGQTPLVHIQGIFNSKPPFIGHHHEYTIEELKWLLERGGFPVERLETYNYSPYAQLKRWYDLLPISMRETILAYGRKQA